MLDQRFGRSDLSKLAAAGSLSRSFARGRVGVGANAGGVALRTPPPTLPREEREREREANARGLKCWASWNAQLVAGSAGFLDELVDQGLADRPATSL